MANFIFNWIWQTVLTFTLIFTVALFLIHAKSYDIVDFETRSNQFSSRVMMYAQDDGMLTLSDFTSENVVDILGGDEATSETFSAKISIYPIILSSDTVTWGDPIVSFYAQDTFERQYPTVNLNSAYVLKTVSQYVYLTDESRNARIDFAFIYKK